MPLPRPQKRIKLFRQGELGGLIMGALRRAGGPLGLREVVTAILISGGLSEEARPGLTNRVRANLDYLERRSKAMKLGNRRGALWMLAD